MDGGHILGSGCEVPPNCKPENFIMGNDGRVYVLDLEQGERHGDKKWDVAQFLFFSGHFGSTLTKGFHQFVKEFIKGYSTVGEKEVLRKAAGFQYAKVFFVWTPKSTIQSISKMLMNA